MKVVKKNQGYESIPSTPCPIVQIGVSPSVVTVPSFCVKSLGVETLNLSFALVIIASNQ